MKSRLFPPGRVALVVNSSLFTPPALARRKNPSISFGTLWLGIGMNFSRMPGGAALRAS
jgi:hypothetical protein